MSAMFVRRCVFIFGSVIIHICNSEYIALSCTVMSEQLIGNGVEARVMTSFMVKFRQSFEVTEETHFGHSNCCPHMDSNLAPYEHKPEASPLHLIW